MQSNKKKNNIKYKKKKNKSIICIYKYKNLFLILFSLL